MQKPEIERRFIADWLRAPVHIRNSAVITHIKQGYLPSWFGRTNRIRITNRGSYFTSKRFVSAMTSKEFEIRVPTLIAKLVYALTKDQIVKTRYTTPFFGWETDVFEGNLAGVCIAEIELDSEQAKFVLPRWVSDCEVTECKELKNVFLAKEPDLAIELYKAKRKSAQYFDKD